MTYIDQWRALSNRIRGLMEAAQLYARFQALQASDSHNVGRRLQEQGQDVLRSLQSFQEQYDHQLPQAALTCIRRFVSESGGLISSTSGSSGLQRERTWGTPVLLAAFETEMSFLLSDTQESIRVRSERAFSHLQRLIVVDPEFRDKWQTAFEEGREEALEKLGAVHLLLHGIWAFKVNAEGARTDLVFQEPAGDLVNEQRYADGFVLTEWKKTNRGAEAERRFADARLQAQRYAQGVLAGSELTSYRYAVVVSDEQVEVPSDIREGDVTYRHINIAVRPRVPSHG